MKKALNQTLYFVSSYGFATVIFLFLLLLVFLGTVEQVSLGLYVVQKKYFESLFLVHRFGPIPVPLPGVYLLLLLFTANLLAGIILRMRKGLPYFGILIVHLGMILMLLGGFVKFKFSDDGHMSLWEKDQSNVFESYHDYEIAIAPAGGAGPVTEYLIPQKDFLYLKPGQSVTFHIDALPFDLTLNNFMRNCMPSPKGPMADIPYKVVDGMYLQPLEPAKESERNVPGAYATITEKKTGETREAILLTSSRSPGYPPSALLVESGGQPWKIDLRKRQWQLPFTIVLDKFTHEIHPRTSMAKAFMSDVTKMEGGTSQKIKIAMNEPLRYKGYTLFQASYGPSNAAPGERMFSTFAVVRNPADHWPLYSCIVVTLGLVIHFSQKLLKYLRAESKRMAS